MDNWGRPAWAIRKAEAEVAREFRENPGKEWANVARHKCGVCGTIIDVGEPVRRGGGKTCHAGCQ